METAQTVSHLENLAAEEMKSATRFFDALAPEVCSAFVMEACRVLDYEHVLNRISSNPIHHRYYPEFDLLVRGWNPFLGLALPRMALMNGVPMTESTQQSRAQIRSLLTALGTCSIVRKSASMLLRVSLATCAADRPGAVATEDRTALSLLIRRPDTSIRHVGISNTPADFFRATYPPRIERLEFSTRLRRGF